MCVLIIAVTYALDLFLWFKKMNCSRSLKCVSSYYIGSIVTVISLNHQVSETVRHITQKESTHINQRVIVDLFQWDC